MYNRPRFNYSNGYNPAANMSNNGYYFINTPFPMQHAPRQPSPGSHHFPHHNQAAFQTYHPSQVATSNYIGFQLSQTPNQMQSQQQANLPQREKKTLAIRDPETGRDVLKEMRQDSSKPEKEPSPQLTEPVARNNMGGSEKDICAQFAAQVAVVASSKANGEEEVAEVQQRTNTAAPLNDSEHMMCVESSTDTETLAPNVDNVQMSDTLDSSKQSEEIEVAALQHSSPQEELPNLLLPPPLMETPIVTLPIQHSKKSRSAKHIQEEPTAAAITPVFTSPPPTTSGYVPSELAVPEVKAVTESQEQQPQYTERAPSVPKERQGSLSPANATQVMPVAAPAQIPPQSLDTTPVAANNSIEKPPSPITQLVTIPVVPPPQASSSAMPPSSAAMAPLVPEPVEFTTEVDTGNEEKSKAAAGCTQQNASNNATKEVTPEIDNADPPFASGKNGKNASNDEVGTRGTLHKGASHSDDASHPKKSSSLPRETSTPNAPSVAPPADAEVSGDDGDTGTPLTQSLKPSHSPTDEAVGVPSEAQHDRSQSPPTAAPHETQEDNKSTLQQLYKKGQWSPDKPSGERKYDRKFLLELQNSELSKRRPDFIRPVEVALDAPHRQYDARQPIVDFSPQFLQQRKGGSMQARYPSRGSQPGRITGARGMPPKIIDIKLSGSQDAKLKSVENPWLPQRKKDISELSNTDKKTDHLLRRMRAILNKLTPDNFDGLVGRVKELEIDSYDQLDAIIGLVFEKAVDEQSFAATYAKMCNVLSAMAVNIGQEANNKNEHNFRHRIITRCQNEFQKDNLEDLKREDRLKEIEECTDANKKLELKLQLEYDELRARKRSVGNIRFIGELYILKMLTSPIMMKVIGTLLQKRDEESLECLCKLLTTIGKLLEETARKAEKKAMENLEEYFKEMEKIVNDKSTSSRVRFLMMDVIDLRKDNWKPRRELTKPKTKAQVHEEIRKEEEELNYMLGSGGGGGRRDDKGGQDRGKRMRDSRTPEEGGWNTVSQRKGAFDSSRLKNTFMRCGSDTVQLGTGYSSWGRGSSGGLKDQQVDDKDMASNRFSVLDNQAITNQMRRGPRLSPGGDNLHHTGFGSKSMPPPSEKNILSHVKKPVLPSSSLHPDRSKGSSRNSSRENSQARERSISRENSVPVGAACNYFLRGNPASSEEESRKHAIAITEEYMSITDFKEAETCVAEKFCSKNIHLFVANSMEHSLERETKCRHNMGKLYSQLISNSLIYFEQFSKGAAIILENIDDFIVDFPFLCSYIAELLAPIVVSHSLSLENIWDCLALAQDRRPEIYMHMMALAAKDMNKDELRKLWKASNLSLSKIVPQGHKSEDYLKKYGGLSASSLEDMDPFEQHLITLKEMFRSEPDTIPRWLQENGTTDNIAFKKKLTRALVTALVENEPLPSPKGPNIKQIGSQLKTKSSYISKYVDSDEQLELQCIFALQALSNKLQHPPGFLEQWFGVFYENDILSEEVFFEWEENKEPEEQAGKGVCVASVKTFLKWLLETEAEDEVLQA